MQIVVIIPAYNADKYIEQCLDSVTRNRMQHSILLGIDGCEKTLDKVQQIKHKYSNLTAVFFPENQGCYITLNTLVKMCPEDSLIQVFGADDVMHPNMLKEMFYASPCYSKFSGISMLHKSYYDKLGGYMPWRIAADTEFLYRIRKIEPRFKPVKQLFNRRIHADQLTSRPDTGMKSELRAKYAAYIEKNKHSDKVKIRPKTHTEWEIL